MASEIVARRRSEREGLIDIARQYARRLSARLPVRAAYVAGSVARGDFNVWSDIDVVVVAHDLPQALTDRTDLLMHDAPPRVQPVGYTPEEFRRAQEKRNPLVIEAIELGVVLIEYDGRPGTG